MLLTCCCGCLRYFSCRCCICHRIDYVAKFMAATVKLSRGRFPLIFYLHSVYGIYFICCPSIAAFTDNSLLCIYLYVYAYIICVYVLVSLAALIAWRLSLLPLVCLMLLLAACCCYVVCMHVVVVACF